MNHCDAILCTISESWNAFFEPLEDPKSYSWTVWAMNLLNIDTMCPRVAFQPSILRSTVWSVKTYSIHKFWMECPFPSIGTDRFNSQISLAKVCCLADVYSESLISKTEISRDECTYKSADEWSLACECQCVCSLTLHCHRFVSPFLFYFISLHTQRTH